MKTRKIVGRCNCGYETLVEVGSEVPEKMNLLRWNFCPDCEDENGNDELWEERLSFIRKRIKKTQMKLF